MFFDSLQFLVVRWILIVQCSAKTAFFNAFRDVLSLATNSLDIMPVVGGSFSEMAVLQYS